MATHRPRLIAVLTLALAGLLWGCGGSDEPAPADGAKRLTVWILESEPERLRATRDNVARFTQASAVDVELVGIGDDELAERMTAAEASGRLPDAVQLPMDSAHTYARSGVLSSDAAQDVVNKLGEETFSARALSLLTSEGRVTAVPSDGWGQLLIYRKGPVRRGGAARAADAGRRPARRPPAAPRRPRGDHAGDRTFAVHGGDARARRARRGLPARRRPRQRDAHVGGVPVRLQAPRRPRAPVLPPGGAQDVESTRDTYFAGRAAMIFWSPFVLDAMAGLRDEAVPCRADTAYLARHSGLVGPLAGPSGDPAQFGNVSTWGVTADGDVEGAQRFVAYMMSDGYLPWLALSPQGKYPVRFGDRSEPDRYVNGWAGLQSGVERKAPLSRFYSERSIASIGEGARSFQRWGFEQGGAALLGAMRGPEPVAMALAAEIEGEGDAAAAPRQAQRAVEELQAELQERG